MVAFSIIAVINSIYFHWNYAESKSSLLQRITNQPLLQIATFRSSEIAIEVVAEYNTYNQV